MDGAQGASIEMDRGEARYPEFELTAEVELEKPELRLNQNWGMLNVSLPAAPFLSIGHPPTVSEPSAPNAPVVSVTIPELEYEYPSMIWPSDITVTVPAPPSVNIAELTLDVPDFTATIPDGQYEWAYEQYQNGLFALIEPILDRLDSSYDLTIATWIRKHTSIWSRSFNLINAMGHPDVIEEETRKAFEYGRAVYHGAFDSIMDKIRAKNVRIYIDAKLGIERSRRAQYMKQKEAELAYAKAILSNSISYYNLCVKVYAAQIEKYRAHTRAFIAAIETNDARLRAYEMQIKGASLVSEANRAILKKYQIEVEAQVSLVRLYQSQMEMAEKVSRLEIIQVELFRQEIEAFIAQVKAISERADQERIVAEVEGDRAELLMGDAYYNKLLAQKERVQGLIEASREKYDIARETFLVKVEALLSSADSLELRAAATSDHLNAEVLLESAQYEGREAQMQSQADVERSETTAAGNEALSRVILAQDEAGTMAGLTTTRNLIDKDRAFNVVSDFQVRRMVADILRKASIVNTLIESLGS